MQASQPLRPPSSRTDGHLGAIGLFIVVGLLVAIVKPWGSGAGDFVVDLATPVPSATPSPTPSVAPQIGFSGLAYDRSIFGNHEPEAVWEIWPAGFLVTFGFVIQVPGAPATPSPSTGPGSSAVQPTGSGGASGPAWPSRLDLPDGDHLLLIGIDMPHGYRVTASRLALIAPDAADVAVPIQQFKSPWPEHFAVLGIPTTPGKELLDVWPPGRYRLDLTFAPGGISRSIEIQITAPLPVP